jgi:hypothetical protein
MEENDPAESQSEIRILIPSAAASPDDRLQERQMWDIALLLTGTVLALVAVSGVVWVGLRLRKSGRGVDPQTLQKTRIRLQTILNRIPKHRSVTHSAFPPIEAAGAIEAWLLQNLPQNALVAAMHAVKQTPENADAYLHLARVLLHCNEPEGALRALMRARHLGGRSPAYRYLEARLKIQSTGWHPGHDKAKIEDSSAAVTALNLLVNVLEDDPAFGEAVYHAAVLAHAVGLEKEGKALFKRAEPLMEVSPEKTLYLGDVDRLN